MSAVAMANTALAHDAQPSVRKRSAWRAWFELRLNEHTFGLEEPPSAEIGRRRTSKARGCHAATPAMLSPETENCWCKLPVRRRNSTALRVAAAAIAAAAADDDDADDAAVAAALPLPLPPLLPRLPLPVLLLRSLRRPLAAAAASVNHCCSCH